MVVRQLQMAQTFFVKKVQITSQKKTLPLRVIFDKNNKPSQLQVNLGVLNPIFIVDKVSEVFIWPYSDFIDWNWLENHLKLCF